MNWQTIATVALTAITTILATCGVVGSEDSTNLATTGASAITGVAAFVAAILTAIRNRKDKGNGNA